MFNFQITFHVIILLVFRVDILVIGRKLFKKTEKEEEKKLSFIDRNAEDEENRTHKNNKSQYLIFNKH